MFRIILICVLTLSFMGTQIWALSRPSESCEIAQKKIVAYQDFHRRFGIRKSGFEGEDSEKVRENWLEMSKNIGKLKRAIRNDHSQTCSEMIEVLERQKKELKKYFVSSS